MGYLCYWPRNWGCHGEALQCFVKFIWQLKKINFWFITYSKVQSPSWEANWFTASQEIPRISRNPNVHYRTHKRPPPVSILRQPNPVHIPTSHLLKIHPNIHPSTPRSPQWSPSLRFPQQEPTPPPSPYPYAPHAILDFITRTILGEEYKSFSSSLCNLYTIIVALVVGLMCIGPCIILITEE